MNQSVEVGGGRRFLAGTQSRIRLGWLGVAGTREGTSTVDACTYLYISANCPGFPSAVKLSTWPQLTPVSRPRHILRTPPRGRSRRRRVVGVAHSLAGIHLRPPGRRLAHLRHSSIATCADIATAFAPAAVSPSIITVPALAVRRWVLANPHRVTVGQ